MVPIIFVKRSQVCAVDGHTSLHAREIVCGVPQLQPMILKYIHHQQVSQN
jgi:hypothetical protein